MPDMINYQQNTVPMHLKLVVIDVKQIDGTSPHKQRF